MKDFTQMVLRLKRGLPSEQKDVLDTVFQEMTGQTEKKNPGVGEQMLSMFRKTREKEIFLQLFCLTTGFSFQDYLLQCLETIGQEMSSEKVKSFQYRGFTFIPYKTLPSSMHLRTLGSHLFSENELKMGTQQPDVDKRSWNYGDFCEASKNTDAVIFICKETGKLYFPTEHELFGWKEDPNEEEML